MKEVKEEMFQIGKMEAAGRVLAEGLISAGVSNLRPQGRMWLFGPSAVASENTF